MGKPSDLVAADTPMFMRKVGTPSVIPNSHFISSLDFKGLRAGDSQYCVTSHKRRTFHFCFVVRGGFYVKLSTRVYFPSTDVCDI